MKLGEALSLRAKQAYRLNDLQGRIRNNAMSQEGETPSEDPVWLLNEYVGLSKEHQDLVRRINLTNVTSGAGYAPISDLLQERQHLIRVRNIYRTTADAGATINAFRFGRAEIKSTSNVDVAALREMEEECDEEVRQLDAKIQGLNWQVDLL